MLYMPRGERKKAIERARVRAIVKMNFAAGTAIDCVWVTKDVARAVVSARIDDERISTEDADRDFALLRAPDRYNIHVRYSELDGGPKPKEKSLFLQRADDNSVFSRGSFADALAFDSGARVTVDDVNHVIAFPRSTESGVPIVRSGDDKIEVSILTQYAKPGIASFRVGDLVRQLSDL